MSNIFISSSKILFVSLNSGGFRVKIGMDNKDLLEIAL